MDMVWICYECGHDMDMAMLWMCICYGSGFAMDLDMSGYGMDILRI